jgi:hypothetical protein
VSDTRPSAACGPQADRNLTPIATLIEDPARSAMLAALAGGRALPAGELARRAGVQPATASVHLTDRGQHLVKRLDIDLAALRASRRVFARSCVDWSDRRIHLAGALPAAITSVFIARGWLSDAPGRCLHVAERFDDKIDEWLAT